MQTAIRAWFAGEGFIEIEPAALQVSPGNELHLHAFATRLEAPDGRAAPRFLHTSPEQAMKKLLAAGEQRIFAFARVFRNRERSPLHAPEFTMLEWYRAGESYTRAMADCAALARVAAAAADTDALTHGGRAIDLEVEPETVTVAEAFSRFAGIDLLAALSGSPDREALAAGAAAAGIRVAPDDSWSDIFSRVLGARVEPQLGRDRMTFLTEYPAPAAALARLKAGDPRVAERFELFACGVELANGFGELTDADEQRRRFAADMAAREKLYGDRYPIDEDFLAAVARMPAASGVALGFDRLVMLATGASRIEDVQWTPSADPFG